MYAIFVEGNILKSSEALVVLIFQSIFICEWHVVVNCLKCNFICRRGLTDELGAEAMMMDALEKVEKEIKKPLMRNDKKGMALLTEEFNKINQK